MSRTPWIVFGICAPLALVGFLLSQKIGDIADNKARQLGHTLAPGASYHCNAPLSDWVAAYDAAPDDAKPAPPVIDEAACRAEQFALAERAHNMILALSDRSASYAQVLRDRCEDWSDPATIRGGYGGVIECYRREGARIGVTWGTNG